MTYFTCTNGVRTQHTQDDREPLPPECVLVCRDGRWCPGPAHALSIPADDPRFKPKGSK